MNRTERGLTGKVDDMKGDLVCLLSKLVKTRSENPPGDTSEVAELCLRYAEDSGIKAKRFETSEGKVNLVLSVGEGIPGLVLCGHLDTVPAGDRSRWSFEPFSGAVDGGRVLGRGSVDMKGGVAAMLVAGKALTNLEEDFGRVTITLTCDEEVLGELGAKWIVNHGLAEGTGVIVGEPTNTHRCGHLVAAGEKGIFWCKALFKGTPGHGSMPMLAQSAIIPAVRMIHRLGGPFLGRVRVPHDAKPLIAGAKRVMLKEMREIRSKKPHYSLDHYTVNVGLISGGTKVNVVPPDCEVVLDVRLPIGGTESEIESTIKRFMGEGRMEILAQVPATFTSRSERLVQVVRRSAKDIFCEKSPATCVNYTTDANFFRVLRNLPAVSYGPGYQELLHAYDEWVGLDDVLSCSKVYALSAFRYGCGGAR